MADYETLVPDELRRALAENAIVYMPMGSIEWHNNHLPFNVDSIIGYGLCRRLAAETGGLILPPNPWATGCTFAKRGPYQFEPGVGTVALFDPDLYLRLVQAVVRGVAENGFRRVVILAGHVGKDDRVAMEQVAEEVTAGGEAKALFLYPYLVTKGDHAGHWETLMMLGLRPDLVRSGKEYVEFAYGTPLTGTETEEEGRRKIDECAKDLLKMVCDFFGLSKE